MGSVDLTVSFILRLLLAFIFLRGALHKLGKRQHFHAQLAAYQLLPAALVPAFSIMLPLIEGYLACALLAERWTHPSFAAAALLSVYALAMAINLVKDRDDLDCGCGGPSGFSQRISWALVARNTILAMFALVTALPIISRNTSMQDIGTICLASLAVILIYCSVEQAIINRQRESQYYAVQSGGNSRARS